MSRIINTRIALKHDIEDNWNISTLIPYSGEVIIYDADDSHYYPRVKIGNGVDLPKDLPFITSDVTFDDSVWLDCGTALINVDGGDSDKVPPAAGLYQTGAIALYKEQDAEAVEGMLITPWDDLLANETIHVENGIIYTNVDLEEWVNASSDILAGDLVLPCDGTVIKVGDYDPDVDIYVAFGACTNLTGVLIPNTVTSIGNAAFDSCTALTDIDIPNSVTEIQDGAFYGCSLTSITIPNSVTSIGIHQFEDCDSLVTVVLPESLTTIDVNMCFHCNVLESVTIPVTVEYIDEYAFGSCSNLKEINYAGTKAQWNNIEKHMYWDSYTDNYTVYCTDGTIVKAEEK